MKWLTTEIVEQLLILFTLQILERKYTLEHLTA